MDETRSTIKNLCEVVDRFPDRDTPLAEMQLRNIERGKYDATAPIRDNLQKVVDFLRIFGDDRSAPVFETMPASFRQAVWADVESLYKLAKELPIKCQPQKGNVVPPHYDPGQEPAIAQKVDHIFGHLYSNLLPLRASIIELQKEPIQADVLRPSSMPLHKTAFISYSWDDETHKKWVRDLATRLRTDGIDVRLDHWHTVPGDQLPEFMEREIRDNDYVLVICTPKYKTKSEARTGGVGYEGDIMTAEVLAKQNHRKFIPLLARGAWVEAAPSWLLGKRYVDLSDAARYEQGYSDLLTTILGTGPKPPPLGPLQPGNPPFLDDQPTRTSVRTPYGPMVSDQRSSELIELAKKNPRAAIRETWSELGSAILGAANVQSGNTHPTSADIMFSLKRLEYDTRFPSELIRSIPELQEKARKVVDQSIYAYDPSSVQAQQFVRDAVAVANELAQRF